MQTPLWKVVCRSFWDQCSFCTRSWVFWMSAGLLLPPSQGLSCSGHVMNQEDFLLFSVLGAAAQSCSWVQYASSFPRGKGWGRSTFYENVGSQPFYYTSVQVPAALSDFACSASHIQPKQYAETTASRAAAALTGETAPCRWGPCVVESWRQ